MALVMLGINADVGEFQSAAERAAGEAARLIVRAAEGRFHDALERLAVPSSCIRVRWDTLNGWCSVRVQRFDGVKVRKLWRGPGLEPLTAASLEFFNAAKASRVRGVRAQAIVFHGWHVEGPSLPLETALALSPEERDYLLSALSTATDRRVHVLKPFRETPDMLTVVPFDARVPAPPPLTWFCVRTRHDDGAEVWQVSEG